MSVEDGGALPPTEAADAATRGLDVLATPDLVALLVARQEAAVRAVADVASELARAVAAIVERLATGGTLHYVGAGTSGRIATLDAAECPPTFGTPPGLVRAHIAGGSAALVRAVEGAEDDAAAGASEAAVVRAGDAVVGISAGGGAPYVVAFVRAARERGAYTVALTSVAGSALARAAELGIVLATGPEPLAGSTRLVAGTAQKLALNAISTATMVRLGKVYDNLMVDVVATNAKLRARALRLVKQLAPLEDDAKAAELLAAADGSVKLAVVMARRRVDAAAGRALLEAAGGSLRAVLEGRSGD